ncbi:MAG: PTS sugar transporter subunit IIC [Tissierellia bacterium]|nr:PTS sugar transporter subunit IIC [Tissierellia bacterium]
MKHSIQAYAIKTLNALAAGVFATLLIGLILKQIGSLIHWEFLIQLGGLAQLLMGPGIGVAVAHILGAGPLALAGCAVIGALGAGTIGSDFTLHIGEPVGAFVAAIIAAEAGKFVYHKTNMDILLVPTVTLVIGALAAKFVSPVMSYVMSGLGNYINHLTVLHPLPMGILISLTMGMILTLPISSAAISISLQLGGLAAGAATAGCAANMIGFAMAGYKDNTSGSAVAVGLGTSMLQFPNIVKNPWTWLPAMVASVITGPLSTLLFQMKSNPNGAGMGTSGLVGQLMMVETMGYSTGLLLQISLLHFILPGLIAYGVYVLLLRWGKIQKGDYKLHS